MSGRPGRLEADHLEHLLAEGEVDTVIVAFPDMQGRLTGKRIDARFFLDSVSTHGCEACSYLLAVDAEMTTVEGYRLSSWESGYGDFVLVPDLATLRRSPGNPGSLTCLADLTWSDGAPVEESPRHVLRRQIERLAERGWRGLAGTELEFLVFAESYEQAWTNAYRSLTPANLYNVDYSILGGSRVEPLLRRIRAEMSAADMVVESAKGECNRGQHEIAFRYADLLTKADEHLIYKNGAKEIAAQEGHSLTFMAKFDEREGNSCHIHLSLRDAADAPVFAGEKAGGVSATFQHFLAGLMSGLRELTLLLAPHINSYKRYVEDSFAPTALAWGWDNRTCAFRVVGRGASLRIETRVPGGDANPYLAIAALVAAGLHGVEHELELPPPMTGNAYHADCERLPTSLEEAADLFERSELARKAFGEAVVGHYVNMARTEVRSFRRAVTDWERYRCFERM